MVTGLSVQKCASALVRRCASATNQSARTLLVSACALAHPRTGALSIWSEHEPDAELHVARRSGLVHDRRKRLDDRSGCSGRLKVKFVWFNTLKNRPGTASSRHVDRELLAQRDVPHVSPGPRNSPRRRPARSFRRGLEGRGLARYGAGRSVADVGIADQVGTAAADRGVGGDGQRRARLRPRDAADLPAAEHAADAGSVA